MKVWYRSSYKARSFKYLQYNSDYLRYVLADLLNIVHELTASQISRWLRSLFDALI